MVGAGGVVLRTTPAASAASNSECLVNVRNGIAAVALLSIAVFTVGCATPTAGTASVGSAAVTAASSTSGDATATSTTAAPSSTASSTEWSTSSSSGSSTPETTSSPSTADWSTADSSTADSSTADEPIDLDSATQAWLETSCTDIGTLYATLFAVPTVDETAPVEQFRTAYRDYYASLADTVLGMTDRLSQLDPPQIADGQALHDGYLQYLTKLADIAGSGAIAIDEAPADPQAIADIIEHIQFDTERLGESDLGLGGFQGDELRALMAQVPACKDLLES